MDAAPPRLGGGAASDHIGQGGGAAEAPFLGQVLLNLAGDAARQALLAVGIDQIGQLCLVQPVDQLPGGLAGLGVHAHVQRAGQPETEAPRRHVELGTAHPQVGQHRHCRLGRDVVGKVGGHDRDAISKRGEALGGGGTGARVLVQPYQVQAGIGLQQQGAVAAAAEGAIDQQSFELGKALQQRLGQHRQVDKGCTFGVSHGLPRRAAANGPAALPRLLAA